MVGMAHRNTGEPLHSMKGVQFLAHLRYCQLLKKLCGLWSWKKILKLLDPERVSCLGTDEFMIRSLLCVVV